MTTLAQVRDGIEARLDTIDGLRVYDYIPGDVNYPAAAIFPPVHNDYRDDQGFGSHTTRWVVMLFVPAVVDRQQLDLYDLLDRTGTKSIFAAIEADRKLGGLDVDARVMSAADPLDLGEMAGAKTYQRAVIVEVVIS